MIKIKGNFMKHWKTFAIYIWKEYEKELMKLDMPTNIFKDENMRPVKTNTHRRIIPSEVEHLTRTGRR